VMYIFLPQIYFEITQYKLGKKILFKWIFCVWSTILCKKIGKICTKITMVEVQHGHPYKILQCWQNFLPPPPPFHSVLSPPCPHSIAQVAQITFCLFSFWCKEHCWAIFPCLHPTFICINCWLTFVHICLFHSL
jgi:hypothetical protein